MSRHLPIALTLLVIGIACGGTAAQPLTVEEYLIQVCSDVEEFESLEYEDLTWEQARVIMEDQVEKLNSFTPPTELTDYHNAIVATLQGALEVVKSKDQGAPVNPFEFLSEPEVMALAWAGVAVGEALPSELMARLEDAGCG